MSNVDNKVKMIVEGLLLAAGRPLTLDNIAQVFNDDEKPDRKELKAVMDAIAEECNDRGFELKEVASGFRFQVKQDLSEWVAKLWEERPPRYTRALLETIALIAYRQPITRGDIEEIRGVGVSSNIIRTLIDREWIRVVGHRDVPGRPAMFATTKQFLDYFNVKSLQELPPLSEIKDLDKTEPELDLTDDFNNQRVIDLPEEIVDENSFMQGDGDDAELLAEQEALELSQKPLDEILKFGDEDDDDSEALDSEGIEGDSETIPDDSADSDDQPEGEGEGEVEGDADLAPSELKQGDSGHTDPGFIGSEDAEQGRDDSRDEAFDDESLGESESHDEVKQSTGQGHEMSVEQLPADSLPEDYLPEDMDNESDFGEMNFVIDDDDTPVQS